MKRPARLPLSDNLAVFASGETADEGLTRAPRLLLLAILSCISPIGKAGNTGALAEWGSG